MSKRDFLKYLEENEKAVEKAMNDFKQHSLNLDKKFRKIFRSR